MDRCIESINSQTFTDFEVIMVDDGSTDASYDMLCGFAEKDSRIKIVKQEKNSSLVGARYAGMKNASGEYIVLLDSDDYMCENMLEVLHNRLIGTKPDILRFGYYRDPAHDAYSPAPTDDIVEALYASKVSPSIWKNVYNKRTVIDRVINETEPFYCNMGEDVYFSTVFFTFGQKIDSIPDALYCHEMDTGMSSMTNEAARGLEKIRRSLKDTMASAEHITAFLEKYAPKYLEAAKAHILNMETFAFIQHTAPVTDYTLLVLYAYEYRLMGAEDAYKKICGELIKTKILVDEGYMVSVNNKFVKRKVVENE